MSDPLSMTTLLSLLATFIDFGGSLVIVISAALCLRDALRARLAPASLDDLRLRLADGLVFALSFKTGAGLVRTITIGTWRQFGSLLFIVALRFFLGRVLKAQTAKRASLLRGDGSNVG